MVEERGQATRKGSRLAEHIPGAVLPKPTVM
jgi:hypothetical protein